MVFVVACVFFKFFIGLIVPDFLIPGVSLIFDRTSQVTILSVIFGVIVALLRLQARARHDGRALHLHVLLLYQVFYFVAIGLILPQPDLPDSVAVPG